MFVRLQYKGEEPDICLYRRSGWKMSNTVDYSYENGSGGYEEEECASDLYVKIMATILFVVVWPFVVLDMKWFPIGRPAAALMGAVLMVVFHIVSQSEVYEIQGQVERLQTLFLLVGMMILSYYFDREGLLRIVALWIIGKNKPFRHILWKVCLLSAILSAFITNDATCLVIVPLLLNEFTKQERNQNEILPLLLGIATSANIGSAATVFGNPQNSFIASVAKINLIKFLIALLPAAIIGTFLSMGLLYLFFFKIIFGKKSSTIANETESIRQINNASGGSLPISIDNERRSIVLSHDRSDQPFLSSQIARERELVYSSHDQIYRSTSIRQLPQSGSRYSMPVSFNHDQERSGVYRSTTSPNVTGRDEIQGSLTIELSNNDQEEYEPQQDVNEFRPIKKRTIREKIFMIWLITISIVVIVLLAIPPPPTVPAEFNLGCVPVAAAILTMLVDTIVNRKYAYDAIQKIDWTLILMFMGLFVWLDGFQKTCFPELLFNKLRPYMNLNKIGGVLLFAVFIIVGSNIFSNVPLVILFVKRINELCGEEPCSGPLAGLLLAWVSTVAGNFTLIGSVANLIVAEKARQTANYKLTFWRYLRFGFFSTIIVLFTALPIVYFLGQLAQHV